MTDATVVTQRRVEELVLDGKNVFFTGNAGTGKQPLFFSVPRNSLLFFCIGDLDRVCPRARREVVPAEPHRRRSEAEVRRRISHMCRCDGCHRHSRDAHWRCAYSVQHCGPHVPCRALRSEDSSRPALSPIRQIHPDSAQCCRHNSPLSDRMRRAEGPRGLRPDVQEGRQRTLA
jgi:hypothetical protein